MCCLILSGPVLSCPTAFPGLDGSMVCSSPRRLAPEIGTIPCFEPVEPVVWGCVAVRRVRNGRQWILSKGLDCRRTWLFPCRCRGWHDSPVSLFNSNAHTRRQRSYRTSTMITIGIISTEETGSTGSTNYLGRQPLVLSPVVRRLFCNGTCWLFSVRQKWKLSFHVIHQGVRV